MQNYYKKWNQVSKEQLTGININLELKIVFALPFKDNVVSGYSLPEVGIKDHNVVIDGRTL